MDFNGLFITNNNLTVILNRFHILRSHDGITVTAGFQEQDFESHPRKFQCLVLTDGPGLPVTCVLIKESGTLSKKKEMWRLYKKFSGKNPVRRFFIEIQLGIERHGRHFRNEGNFFSFKVNGDDFFSGRRFFSSEF